ncbi:glyoxalase [Streptomyces alfalfae]|uniref:Glyoxalase n=1 Tax=Streptomyces alfalfae TaxID=1642299 RepID=A0A1P8TM27_9ACTN|nr:VOC family protein [Streptomyces alfalfae]AYA19070.1 glyoxalase [Streptomyces fradiae]APY88654.1 glyoxalase [Streptomyces alfalfae]QQC88951.1 VOC family protein [Streptomyces alfalfae]QUI31408.1 VOC family protein [Streptomyces alfalfae]RXX35893.1 glyoxalase [Streptomyces alfalfae]
MDTTQGTTQTPAPGATPAPTIWPTLQAEDALALIDFFVDTVGFLRTAVYEDGDRVAHAQLDWPEGGGIMLGSYDPEAAGGTCGTPGTSGAYVVTDQVDALYGRLTAAGVKIISGIEDKPYGSREFGIADPEGNRWFFGTYRGEPRPPETP